MTPKRILFIGQLFHGSTAVSRLRAIKRLGYETTAIDQCAYLNTANRVIRAIEHRVGYGPNIARLRSAITAALCKERYDLVWIEKANYLSRASLEELKAKAGRTLWLHYTPDPAFTALQKSINFPECVKHYDILVTTKLHELSEYSALGAPRILFALQGYGDHLTPSDKGIRTYLSDITFIGHHEHHYEQIIRQLVQQNEFAISVRGDRWMTLAKSKGWARTAVTSGNVYGSDYTNALQTAKIGLGLLSKWSQDTSTTRTFEIPACGSFLLAERTEEHQTLFTEGHEAEFFATAEELKDKARFYLRNDDARVAIARAGQLRCERSGYSTIEQTRKILEQAFAGLS